MDAAADLPPDKRAVFLERVAARLQLRGSFTSDDLAKAGSNSLMSISRMSRAATQPPSCSQRDEARRIAANIAKLPELVRED